MFLIEINRFQLYYFSDVFPSELSKSLSSWLTKLNEPRERSAELSTHYRNVGNNYHSKNADPDNLATDYFTKAIFSAPNNSIELAYAHSNRAASLYRQLNAVDVSVDSANHIYGIL